MRNDEIKALREEVARLRERVAVLEARPAYQPPPTYRVVPMMEPPYYVGDMPGWWMHGPTAQVSGTIPADATTCLRN